MSFKLVEEAIKAIEKGIPVVVVDDENRENEGDLILAAEKATAENIGFMIRYTSGILCVSMKGDDLDRLELPLMVDKNTEKHRTAFTISVDAKEGTTTGISSEDRVKTIHTLADPNSKPSDLLRPGHIFPLRYCEGGVLKRAGHTEASLDLVRLAGLQPAAVLSEIVNDNGSVAKKGQIEDFASKHGLVKITIADLIKYRHHHEKLVEKFSEAVLPTNYGDFRAYVYISALDGIEHLALVKGDVRNQENVLVRVHSECLTGDVLSSKRCDCGAQLDIALKTIAEEGQGALIYLRGHEGRGIGLKHKLRAYSLQDQGCDTVEANTQLGLPVDSREYGIGAQMLVDLGVTTMRLLTNNPAKYTGLSGYGLEIVERVALNSKPTKENIDYLRTKKIKMGHTLDIGA